METRSAASATTRARLTEAALAVVSQVGAEALTMQGVAETADVALRTLYNYFPTREELLREAMTNLLDDTRAAVRELVPDKGSPRERVLLFVEAYYRSYERQGVAAAALLRAQGVAGVEEQVAEIRAWRRQQLNTLLRAAAADRGLRLPTAQAVALAYSLTAYATWSALVNDSRLSPNAARAAARHTIESAIVR
jgi:AcrR family transcriptional regulator